MRGWKTKSASIGGMLTGAGMVAAGLLSDPPNWSHVFQGLGTIAGFLGIWGVGHKIEKGRK